MTQYTYEKDTKIEITGEQFQLFLQALVQGVEATIERKFVEKRIYVDPTTGKEVKSPSAQAIATGEVRLQTDFESTFAEPMVTFSDKLTPAMLHGSLLAQELHQKFIAEGIAKEVQHETEGEV